jgi:ATP-dependent Lhr-like helicase
MTLLVKKARHSRGVVPQWLGGRMPLSTELAAAVRRQLQTARSGRFFGAEMRAVKPLLEIQAKWSRIPAEDELLIEKVQTREGFHLFVYPFEGLLVHEGLAALLAYRISCLKPITISMAANDYGFELLSDQKIPLPTGLSEKLFGTGNLLEDIVSSLNLAEMAKRQFREIARVAGLVFQGYPGRPKSTRQVQASSSLLFNVFCRYDSDNLLLKQAEREVLQYQLERHRLAASLGKMACSKIQIVETKYPTPLAFPILVNRLRARISSEKLTDRVRKMQLRLEKAADENRN